VFGQVVTGMDTVDGIRQTRTGNRKGMQDVPIDTIVITMAERLPAE
jgi:cyclophilin family peptidyl-prolyl cis-trans isomerase